jgi:hypothetical protein
LLLPWLLSAVVLAGCGSATTATTTTTRPVRSTSPDRAATCLNSVAFLVEAAPKAVSGSAPDGVTFTMTFYRSQAAARAARARLKPRFSAVVATTVVDFAGNPPAHRGGSAMTLNHLDLVTIRHCVELR